MPDEIRTRGRPSNSKYCYIQWQPIQRDHWDMLLSSKISDLRGKCTEGSSDAPKVDLRGYTIIKGILEGKVAVLSGKDAPNLITTVRDLEYQMLAEFLKFPQVGDSPSKLPDLEYQTTKLKLYDIGKLLGMLEGSIGTNNYNPAALVGDLKRMKLVIEAIDPLDPMSGYVDFARSKRLLLDGIQKFSDFISGDPNARIRNEEREALFIALYEAKIEAVRTMNYTFQKLNHMLVKARREGMNKTDIPKEFDPKSSVIRTL
ncbi:MAG: hypothetical protein KGH61_03500 [Candidatus Micrarchaeota archaeon]|nr:hypothetical protein [Candidatus Micrarchaeota archaeon]MDE1847988.1 hypothetical protein [Candidatus Micrarchaeota archaeon]MDE1864669.1 hypothetical protein [Candidatus Micrarchaeota archaeon]